jgi:hypothetical protein
MLLAYSDHELTSDERRRVATHVNGCELCRHALRDLRDAMGALAVETALLDAREPRDWSEPAHAGRPRAARPLSTVGPSLSLGGAPRRTAWRAARWAAVLVVVVAGGAAAMAVPRWRALLVGPPATPTVVESRGRDAAPPATMTSAAVAVVPVRNEATVALASTMSGAPGSVRVVVSDRHDVQVTVATPSGDRTSPSADLPHFLSSEARLDVQLSAAGGDVQVDVPSTLGTVRVTHNGETIVVVHAGRVSPAAATSGVAIASVHAPK